ncbi:hypothetical protein V6Z12_A09G143300 [Gossypium hirsutum]
MKSWTRNNHSKEDPMCPKLRLQILFFIFFYFWNPILFPSFPLSNIVFLLSSNPTNITALSFLLLLLLLLLSTAFLSLGIIARLCGGRHFGGNGENDIEGWIENKCRSCIDGGVPAAVPPPKEEPKPAREEEKK